MSFSKGVAKNPFGTHPTFSAKAGIGTKSTYLPPKFYLKGGKFMFLKLRITKIMAFDFLYGALNDGPSLIARSVVEPYDKPRGVGSSTRPKCCIWL